MARPIQKNEYGEEISKTFQKNVAKRVLKLPDVLIDDFFFKCNMMFGRRDYNFKALHHIQILQIRESKEGSEAFALLFSERKKGQIERSLKDVEEEFNRYWRI